MRNHISTVLVTWGLRDYGTAFWDGGDEGCDHSQDRDRKDKPMQKSNKGSIRDSLAGNIMCCKCGAKRIDQQQGLEKTPEEYVSNMVDVFCEVRRVLKKDGTLWLNIGDSYMSFGGTTRHHGYTDPKYVEGRKIEHFEPQAYPHPIIKPKDLVGIPWMLAFALRADGWYLRQDIIWSKANPMPESIKDRCTKSHEYIFLFSKSRNYYFDHEAIQEDSVDAESFTGRRPRTGGKRKDDAYLRQGLTKKIQVKNTKNVINVQFGELIHNHINMPILPVILKNW